MGDHIVTVSSFSRLSAIELRQSIVSKRAKCCCCTQLICSNNLAFSSTLYVIHFDQYRLKLHGFLIGRHGSGLLDIKFSGCTRIQFGATKLSLIWFRCAVMICLSPAMVVFASTLCHKYKISKIFCAISARFWFFTQRVTNVYIHTFIDLWQLKPNAYTNTHKLNRHKITKIRTAVVKIS